MTTYEAPLRDYQFILHELLDWRVVTALPGYGEATPDLVGPVIEEIGKFARSTLLPLNRVGDEVGCTVENGVVRTPDGFAEAYQTYCEGGWPALACDPEDGGQGLPEILDLCLWEIVSAANMAFGNYPGLSRGAYKLLREHGTPEQRRVYLPHLADGSWSGTMCLTEAHCGTDLGLMRTRAVPNGDGSYRITGTKIFITSGEHDLTQNIVHLVLAKLPDAPPGVKGISLFVVPKSVPLEDGSLGPRNTLRCGGLEHKMGIRGSATCVMNFDDATGFLVGEPHKGLRCMFTMMNFMRLVIGLQGLGLAETAYQSARRYAKERLQSRSAAGAQCTELPADPIIVHADVRRMLLTMRCYAEGARALVLWVGLQAELAAKHPDAARRAEAEELRSLLTPVVKAFLSDAGFECADLGVQVFGGHGYIREHGMEQLVRDAKITQLYEGTNGIQALDLAARKIANDGGRAMSRLRGLIEEFIWECRDVVGVAPLAEALERALADHGAATAHLAERGAGAPDEVGAAATDYLRLTALLLLGYFWTRAAVLALPHATIVGTSFYDGKLAAARFFAARLLPQTASLLVAIQSGAATIVAPAAETF
jgi:alkylation response protein AidB-like acyl-CoA dehydrogenase